MDNLLTTENLSVDFETDQGIVHAVRNISFDVKKGEILGIVGESGSGKSVTMYSIMGLLGDTAHIHCDSMLFDGTDINPASYPGKKAYSAVMKRLCGSSMAMIFQDPMTFLNPTMKIGKQLCEPILNHTSMTKQQARQRALELMSLVGIPSPETRIDQYPFEFSGGMRQRIIIAIALANNPKLIIADEPTTALDVTIQAQILDLLRRLRDDTGMAVLLITHDLGVVSETADRVVVMYCGQVVEEAEVRSLFDNPMHPYTLGLLKSIPRLEDDDSKRLYMIKGMVPNPLEMPPGCHFSDRCDSCMQVCRERMPELVQVGDHKVRCFLYEEESGKAKNAAEVEKNEEKARAAVEAAREVSTAAALIMGDETQEAEEGKADER